MICLVPLGMNCLVKVLVGMQEVSTSGYISHQTLHEAASATPCNHNCNFCSIVKICHHVQCWAFEIGAEVGVPVCWHP